MSQEDLDSHADTTISHGGCLVLLPGQRLSFAVAHEEADSQDDQFQPKNQRRIPSSNKATPTRLPSVHERIGIVDFHVEQQGAASTVSDFSRVPVACMDMKYSRHHGCPDGHPLPLGCVFIVGDSRYCDQCRRFIAKEEIRRI
jgi:hypothetical protein